MLLNFRQGIVKARLIGGTPDFLQQNQNNPAININITTVPLIVSATFGDSNYLIQESVSVVNAWGPFVWNSNWGTQPSTITYYLYWNIDIGTGKITRGYTPWAPIISSIIPTNPGIDSHWYDLTTNIMKVWNGSFWISTARVFAGSWPMGTLIVPAPLGTQVGITASQDIYPAGFILLGNDLKGIKTSNGNFLTSDSDVIINQGNYTSPVQLEALSTQAVAFEPIPAYYCVTIVGQDQIGLAKGSDRSKLAVGIVNEDLAPGDSGKIIYSGIILNQNWNWDLTLGKNLYVGEYGELTQTLPLPSNQISQQIASIISATSILLSTVNGLVGPGGGGSGNSISQLDSSLTITDTGTNGTMSLVLDGKSKISFTGTSLNVKDTSFDPNIWAAITGDGVTNVTVDTGSAVAIDSVGNVIVSGAVDSAVVIVKYSPLGDIIWQQTYSIVESSSYGDSVVVDSTNDIIIGCFTSTHMNSYAYMKVSGIDGSIIWQYYLDTTLNYVPSAAITIDSGDNLIISGYGDGTNTPVAKISSAGVLVWATSLSNSGSSINFEDVITDSNNNIYLVGAGNGSSNGSIIKLNSLGIIQWQTDITGEFTCYLYAVVAGISNIYVAGTISGNDNYQSVWKIDIATGSIVWGKSTTELLYSQSTPYSIAINPVTETTYITLSYVYNGNDDDNVTYSLDTNGNFLWGSTIGTVANEGAWWNYGHHDSIFRNGNLAITGFTDLLGWNYDIFTLHFPADGTVSGTTTNGFHFLPTTIAFNTQTIATVDGSFTQSVYTPTLEAGLWTAPVAGVLLNSLGYAITLLTLNTDIVNAGTINATYLNTPFIKVTPQNTAYGLNTLFYNTTGNQNTAIGNSTLYSNTTGYLNIATGDSALYSNTTGMSNIATGNSTLYSNTTGSSNIATGENALYFNTTGYFNNAIGDSALYNNTTGYQNTAIGDNALFNNTIANLNIAIGPNAGYWITTGNGNVILGGSTGSTIATLNNHIIIADGAGTERIQIDDLGNCNIVGASLTLNGSAIGASLVGYTHTGATAIGVGAMSSYPSFTYGGDGNVAVGNNAMFSNFNGFGNVAIGDYSLYSSIGSGYNTAIGNSALRYATGSGYNTAVGHGAGNNISTGTNNILMGYSAGSSITTGISNVILGSSTGSSIATLSNHIIIADGAGTERIQIDNLGNCNVVGASLTLNGAAIGGGGGLATDINQNSWGGTGALQSNTIGSSNVAIGFQALYSNTAGYDNTASGYNALYSNTTGTDNVASGFGALLLNTTGSFNVASGINALRNNTTGNNNVAIGKVAGYDAVANITTQSNYVVIGNNLTTNANIKVAWTVTSDARDKTNFTEIPLGLEFVNSLSPIAYQFRTSRTDATPSGRVRYGFKAQDILALEPTPVIINNDDVDNLKYNESSMIPVLVKAIQELKAEFDAYKVAHP